MITMPIIIGRIRLMNYRFILSCRLVANCIRVSHWANSSDWLKGLGRVPMWEGSSSGHQISQERTKRNSRLIVADVPLRCYPLTRPKQHTHLSLRTGVVIAVRAAYPAVVSLDSLIPINHAVEEPPQLLPAYPRQMFGSIGARRTYPRLAC